MSNVFTIAKRELRSFFNAPVAYIVLVTFLLVAGWMFFSTLFLMGRADLRTFFQPSPFSPSMLLVIIAPAVTMKLVAEERRSGTVELLTTLPITDTEVILGKFLAAFALLGTALVATMTYAIAVASLGDLDWGPVFAGYLGILMFAASLVAVGVLTSTLTDNQIVSFIIGFIVSAALYYVYWLQFLLPEGAAAVFEYLSVSSHLANMARGVIDLRDVVYYLTLTGGALYLAVYSLKRQHA